MYNVFTDFHHASLLQSFILLFEKRLGGKVYRPIGTEWHTNGFWKVYDHPATVQQFLGIGAATPDGTQPLNNVRSKEGAIYNCHDIDSGQTNKAITLEGFFALPIDIVIASIPDHIEPFKRLCELHPNKPKLIYQIGNQWNVGENVVKNVLASATIDNVPEGINFISYHQEFDTDVFYPSFPPVHEEHGDLVMTCLCIPPAKNIFSFVNVFQDFPDWPLFKTVENAMPDWTFKSHGGQCRDGAVGPAKVLADTMRESRFIWHTKAGGDGYGHVIHNAAAVGRPLIVKKEYYQGKMAEDLLIDGETCITIDNLSVNEIVNKINKNNDPATYLRMCRAAYDNFSKVCDFDKEFEQIKAFLEALQ